MNDYDGATVLDSAGERLGTVERTYVDDRDSIRFIEVKLGHLFGKHHLIPADQAEMTNDGLRVPFLKDMIEESPNVADEDSLDATTIEAVQSYYATSDSEVDETETESAAVPMQEHSGSAGGSIAPEEEETASTPITPIIDDTDASGQGIHAGEIRDLGDVIEIPVLQEVLVKKTVVKEVIRIKKTDTSEQRTFSGDVRHEDVEIESTEGTPIEGDAEGGMHRRD